MNFQPPKNGDLLETSEPGFSHVGSVEKRMNFSQFEDECVLGPSTLGASHGDSAKKEMNNFMNRLIRNLTCRSQANP